MSLDTAIHPIAGGLINDTFVVGDGDERTVCQRLHPIFEAEVNLDIDAITAHLAAAGMVTPRLVRTRDGALWVVADDGGVWRMLSFVEGITLHVVDAPSTARAAGELVARFHAAVADLDHEFAFARAGVHDTAAHLTALRGALAGAAGHDPARALAADVLAAAADLPDLASTRRRITHGDLKISNVLFTRDVPRAAICLIDLDTLGWQTIAYELGDALRSWCNAAGEDSGPRLDVAIFEAAVAGYAGAAAAEATAGLDAAEQRSIVPGLQTICVELAARFCRDIFEDVYFGWDPTRFASRREHNAVRARGQLALAHQVADATPRLDAIVERAFSRAP